jgi:hypothetical protein
MPGSILEDGAQLRGDCACEFGSSELERCRGQHGAVLQSLQR